MRFLCSSEQFDDVRNFLRYIILISSAFADKGHNRYEGVEILHVDILTFLKHHVNLNRTDVIDFLLMDNEGAEVLVLVQF